VDGSRNAFKEASLRNERTERKNPKSQGGSMKSQFVRTVLIAGLAAIGSLTVSAQSNSADAKIPFAFTANHKSYPAGNYRIQETSTAGWFQLNNYAEAKSGVVTASAREDAKRSEKGHLTFACAKGDCVLSQVWIPGNSVGYIRSASAVDSDLQRKLGVATMVSVRLGH
jgi:hypothetical protein